MEFHPKRERERGTEGGERERERLRDISKRYGYTNANIPLGSILQ